MVEFQDYGRYLMTVSEFKYLGRVLKNSDNDSLAVVGNLRKTRKCWARMLRILGLEVADPWAFSNFYKAVVQATILFGAE